MPTFSDALSGFVVETKTTSLTGPLLYSDTGINQFDLGEDVFVRLHALPLLTTLSTIPVVGIAAGVARMALAVIHTIGHLIAALATFDKGHLYHAAKGACEFLRGAIEAIPVAGRIFANIYAANGFWWIIKIYNPDAPDGLDKASGLWVPMQQNRPSGYVKA